MKEQTPKDWAWTLLIMLIVIAIGLFMINQFFAWQFKNELLQKPCDLCVKLNPNYTRCLIDIQTPTKAYKPINNTAFSNAINITA